MIFSTQTKSHKTSRVFGDFPATLMTGGFMNWFLCHFFGGIDRCSSKISNFRRHWSFYQSSVLPVLSTLGFPGFQKMRSATFRPKKVVPPVKMVFFCCYPSSSIYHSRQLSWICVDPNLAHQVAKSHENQAQITRIMVFFFQLRHDKYHWCSSNPRAHVSPGQMNTWNLFKVPMTWSPLGPVPGETQKGWGPVESWTLKV